MQCKQQGENEKPALRRVQSAEWCAYWCEHELGRYFCGSGEVHVQLIDPALPVPVSTSVEPVIAAFALWLPLLLKVAVMVPWLAFAPWAATTCDT